MEQLPRLLPMVSSTPDLGADLLLQLRLLVALEAQLPRESLSTWASCTDWEFLLQVFLLDLL